MFVVPKGEGLSIWRLLEDREWGRARVFKSPFLFESEITFAKDFV